MTTTGKAKFKERRINDPAHHSKGSVIRVAGVVRLKDNGPQIEVDDLSQIEVLQGLGTG